MSNYTIEVTENVVNLDVLKDHDIIIEIKSSDNFITFETPSGYPILFTSGTLPVDRIGSGYLIENLTSGNTIVRTLGDQVIDGNKTFSNNIVSSGNLVIKSQAASITPSYFPVFISDPSTFSRTVFTRTSSQVKSDIGLNDVQNIALSGINFFAGSGLVGGGNLSSSRSFDIGQGDGLIVTSDSVAVDSTVVRTNVDQVISGRKTFTNPLIFNSGSFQSLQVLGVYVSVSGHTHIISNITGLQTALDDKQASGNYALSSHTHTSSSITDFNTSVDSRITNANLQPSGNYSVAGHTHTISNVTGLQTSLDNKQASGNYSLVGHTHNISDITSLQTTLDNKQPSGSYALSSHAHLSSNITDFNTSVDSRITNANLQPSGNYSIVGHTHTSSNITDFNSSVSGLVNVKNVTAGNYINISSTTGNYTVSVTGLQPSGSYSVTGHTHAISDITNLQTSLDNKQASGNYALNSHTHTSSDITNFNSSVSGVVSGIYAPLSSPALIGTPTAPTASSGTNTTQIASTAFVRTEISNLVASAPTTLDTLNELATALGNDANFSTTVTTNLAGKANLSGATFTGSVSGPSGNFTSLKVNSVDVSAVGHTHTSSNITDFASSVSGLLPVKDVVAGSGISIGSTSGTYTISTFGVAASSASSLITRADNMTGATISKMSVVYINGGHGNRPTIQKSIGSAESTSSKTYGITASDINDNQTGDIVVFGALIDVNTNQFGVSEGSALYLSPSISGGITSTKPLAPNHLVTVGKIVRNHNTQGIIEVSIQNGFELYELHDVAVTGATSGQFLQYNSSSGLWVPSSSGNFSTLLVNGTGVSVSGHTHTSSNITNFDSSVSGLLPVGTANYLSKFGTGGSGLSNSLVFDNGTNVGIGTTTPSKKLDIIGDARVSGVLNIVNISDSTDRSIAVTSNNMTFTAVHGIFDYSVGLRGSRGSACGMESNATNGYLALAAGGSEKVRIATDGKVGIGTTTPSSQLHVIGSGVISSGLIINGNLTFDSFTESVVAIGNSSTSQTISLTSGTVQTCTLTGNCTFTMPTATAGKSFSLFLNTGAGSFASTFTGVRWSDSTAPTITSTASKVDLLSFISDGTYWYGSFSQNYG